MKSIWMVAFAVSSASAFVRNAFDHDSLLADPDSLLTDPIFDDGGVWDTVVKID